MALSSPSRNLSSYKDGITVCWEYSFR